jgi:hypothetical protein
VCRERAETSENGSGRSWRRLRGRLRVSSKCHASDESILKGVKNVKNRHEKTEMSTRYECDVCTALLLAKAYNWPPLGTDLPDDWTIRKKMLEMRNDKGEGWFLHPEEFLIEACEKCPTRTPLLKRFIDRSRQGLSMTSANVEMVVKNMSALQRTLYGSLSVKEDVASVEKEIQTLKPDVTEKDATSPYAKIQEAGVARSPVSSRGSNAFPDTDED